ncbi:MAG: hypothetical protein ACREN7_10330, partial [Candidatus Dormibacteria bacterium]
MARAHSAPGLGSPGAAATGTGSRAQGRRRVPIGGRHRGNCNRPGPPAKRPGRFGKLPCVTLRVGVLGATGIVGQRLIQLLEGHPWFELTDVVASERSAGRPYAKAASWRLSSPIPAAARRLPVKALG